MSEQTLAIVFQTLAILAGVIAFLAKDAIRRRFKTSEPMTEKELVEHYLDRRQNDDVLKQINLSLTRLVDLHSDLQNIIANILKVEQEEQPRLERLAIAQEQIVERLREMRSNGGRH